MKKTVLFLITKATWGGAQKYVYDLATNLPEEFEPIVAYGEEGRLTYMLKERSVRMESIRSLGRDIALISDVASFFQMLACLRRVRPDVLHLNSSKAAALGALAGCLSGVPRIIFTVHGWPFKEQRGALARKLIRMTSWFTAALSDVIIVVSKTDLEIGRKFGVVGGKMQYVPIGIDTPSFLSREEASKILPAAADLPRIVTVAELTANKGIEYAIEAVALLERRGVMADYLVIGDGEERAALGRLAAERGISERVHFLGFRENAARYLKAFDIFLLSSTKEGMPYVLLEAAAAGLPIIATDVVMSEASKLPNIHFVPPADVRALADAVKMLVNNMPTKKPGMVGPFAEMFEKTIALYR